MKKILKFFFGSPKRIRIKKRLNIQIQTKPLGLPKKEYEERKEVFLKIAEEKTKYFNQFYKFNYKRISIRNQKTRWGSCSSKGNLNFNYRVFLLPEKLMDYIIVHELSHLKEMNHSRNFWNLVEKQIPDFKNIRNELKKYYFVKLK